MELFFKPFFKGPLQGPIRSKTNSAATQWAGITQIMSGDITAVVSTSVVKSDSVIMYGISANVRANAGSIQAVEVTSKADGAYFGLTMANGVATTRTIDVMWMIVKNN